MSVTLPPPTSRALALLILLAAVAIVYLGVVAPLLDDYATTQQSTEDMRAAIERYQRVGGELVRRRAELAARQQRQTSEGFLQGTNEALVAAQIQNRLKALVESARGELRSTQVIPGQDEGKYRRVTLRAQMALDLAGAQRVFYGIETASPLLFIDNLDMRSRLGERRRDRGEETTLDIRLDVYGYMRGTKAADRQSVASTSPQASAD
jgi:general secretion pathway protein M